MHILPDEPTEVPGEIIVEAEKIPLGFVGVQNVGCLHEMGVQAVSVARE